MYTDVQTMLTEQHITKPSDAAAAGLTFYNDSGRRLELRMRSDAQTLELVETTEPADPTSVLAMLRTAVRDVEKRIRANPDGLRRLNLSLVEALAMLPDLTGVTVAEAFRRCGATFGHTTGGSGGPGHPSDPGSPFHMIFVHGLS